MIRTNTVFQRLKLNISSISHRQAIAEHSDLPNTEIFHSKDVASVHHCDNCTFEERLSSETFSKVVYTIHQCFFKMCIPDHYYSEVEDVPRVFEVCISVQDEPVGDDLHTAFTGEDHCEYHFY
jgi:hypothetical protein